MLTVLAALKYSSACYEYSESYVIPFINIQWITFYSILHEGIQTLFSENEVLRKMVGPKTGEVSGEFGIYVCSQDLSDVCYRSPIALI